MGKEKLKQKFYNNFDSYADTWKEVDGKMVEGPVILAMTADWFAEVVMKILEDQKK